MEPGARSLAPVVLEPESFGSNCAALKKVLVTLLGLFCTPRSDSASGEIRPRYAPDHRGYQPGVHVPLIVARSQK